MPFKFNTIGVKVYAVVAPTVKENLEILSYNKFKALYAQYGPEVKHQK